MSKDTAVAADVIRAAPAGPRPSRSAARGQESRSFGRARLEPLRIARAGRRRTAGSGGSQDSWRVRPSLLAALALLLTGANLPATANADITASDTWKTQLTYPNDRFLVPPLTYRNMNAVRWVKFTILLNEPQTVLFHDGNVYRLHHEFATERLDPYLGISRADFDAISLDAAGQEIALGAVLYEGGDRSPEVAIQLVRRDPYSAQETIDLLEAVAASIPSLPPDSAVFYFPTLDQSQAAEQHRGQLAAIDIDVDDASRWSEGNRCYQHGWAIGRLKRVDGTEIDSAYAAGELGPADILLTDRLPAEIPFVSGILSLFAATPNSHVAVLASDWESPFVHLSLEADAALAASLDGHEVVLGASPTGSDDQGPCRVRLIDVEGALEPSVADELRALKAPSPLAIAPIAFHGGTSASVDDLAAPDDVPFFGGKAASYGLLRRVIPEHSRQAVALSFDLWQDFLDQSLYDGRTLREEIALRLAPFTSHPPDFVALHAALDSLRDLIRGDTRFSEPQRAAVESALAGFDPERRIRFRSSTNVEDGDTFTGAGLYDSFSGCLADDLDEDAVGPSRCDASRHEERGVYRAIRRVYASFYNDNAFLERLRRGVDESRVGMALLVHHAFPDETELANGVARLERGRSDQLAIVSQPGANSVTNPEAGPAPELVTGFESRFESHYRLDENAEQLALGETVLGWDDEYRQLGALLGSVADAYDELLELPRYALEFEYKKILGEGLVVKQVRRVPLAESDTTTEPFLLNAPARLCVFQGEFSDVFANHHMNAVLSLESRSLRITSANLQQSVYAWLEHGPFVEGSPRWIAGAPEELPSAVHRVDAEQYGQVGVSDGWRDELLGRRYELATRYEKAVSITDPIRTPADASYTLTVHYDASVPALRWGPLVDAPGWGVRPELVKVESVRLVPCDGAELGALQQRTISRPDGVEVDTRFYWPPPPTGISAGYTAPLVAWAETRIAGLTSQPIVLRSRFAQTYRPEHHNFAENFLLAPLRDDGVPDPIKDEWRQAGYDALYVSVGLGASEGGFWMLGADASLRPLPEPSAPAAALIGLALLSRRARRTGKWGRRPTTG